MNWIEYFRENRVQRLAIPWERGVHLAPEVRYPLVRSLQRFQLGESGEGHHIKKRAAESGDAGYAGAIELFIGEEQEHARLMARILALLDAPLLTHHWSDACFIGLRRMMGLRTELLVLLVAEMIATRYFHVVGRTTHDPVVKAVCAQILHDEAGHLAFHAESLNRAFADLSFSHRMLVQVSWRILYRIVCAVVIYDHLALFRASKVRLADFWQETGRVFDETAARIFSPEKVLRIPDFAEATNL